MILFSQAKHEISAKEIKEMTKAQERVIEKIKKDIPYFDFYGNPEGNEIKEFNVEEIYGGIVMLSFTTGMKDDEGTLASVYCRKHRFTLIGKKGGLFEYDDNLNRISYSEFEFMNRRYRH